MIVDLASGAVVYDTSQPPPVADKRLWVPFLNGTALTAGASYWTDSAVPSDEHGLAQLQLVSVPRAGKWAGSALGQTVSRPPLPLYKRIGTRSLCEPAHARR